MGAKFVKDSLNEGINILQPIDRITEQLEEYIKELIREDKINSIIDE